MLTFQQTGRLRSQPSPCLGSKRSGAQSMPESPSSDRTQTSRWRGSEQSATGLGTAEYHLLESGEESASHRRSTGGPSSRRSRSAFCSVGTLDDVLPVSSRPALSTLSRDTANAQVDTAAATQEPSSSTQSPPRLRQPLLRCSLHQDSQQPRHPQSCRRLP